jgi:hypothetical protein
MKRFLFVKIIPYFVGKEEDTGKHIIFNNWRENVIEVFASNINHAKQVAALTGILENEHYHDVLEYMGSV